MKLASLVAFSLGSLAVLQAALNSRVGAAVGLLPAAFTSALVFSACAATTWAIIHFGQLPVPDWLLHAASLEAVRWWWLMPGVFGFAIVLGMPWSLSRMGALPTFVVVVAAQMVTSALWDRYVQHMEISQRRVLGALLALVGAALAARGG